MVYLHTYSGLASRCNTLSQAYQLAKMYNEQLLIFWEISWDCNISYRDIFDTEQFNDIKHKVIEYKAVLPKQKIRRHINMLIREIMRSVFCKIGGVYVDYAPPKDMSWLGNDMQKRVLRCGKEVINALDQKRNIFISAFNGLCIDEIKPASCCREIVFKQKFMKKAEGMIKGEGMWVGVHIRRTDHKLATEHSTLDLFIEKMKEMERTYSSVRFWLATDDREVERCIRKTFKDNVYALRGKQWGRGTKEAMECAVIDCLCLSKCNIILGSFGSSYSGFAACFGNKELIIIDKMKNDI